MAKQCVEREQLPTTTSPRASFKIPVETRDILLALQRHQGIGRTDTPDYDMVFKPVKDAVSWPTRCERGIFLWLVAQCRYLEDFKHRVPDADACMGLWFLYVCPERQAQAPGFHRHDTDRVALNVLVAQAEAHGRRIEAPGDEDSADCLELCRHELNHMMDEMYKLRKGLLEEQEDRSRHSMHSLGALGLRAAVHYRMSHAAFSRTAL
ncbi:uncharacterized protein JCM10292_006972 [Rhodotorula paludigena]|uniref:uncharacterized protein n=1 Tax=Rhodotorula paludigena TaxID=86838 RepID=UPI0031739C98